VVDFKSFIVVQLLVVEVPADEWCGLCDGLAGHVSGFPSPAVYLVQMVHREARLV